MVQQCSQFGGSLPLVSDRQSTDLTWGRQTHSMETSEKRACSQSSCPTHRGLVRMAPACPQLWHMMGDAHSCQVLVHGTLLRQLLAALTASLGIQEKGKQGSSAWRCF